MEISIVNLIRNPSDGLVVSAYWNATKTVGEHTATNPRATQFQRGEGFIAYEQLTEEMVKGWILSTLSEAESEYIENSLDIQLAKMASPDAVPVSGKPW